MAVEAEDAQILELLEQAMAEEVMEVLDPAMLQMELLIQAVAVEEQGIFQIQDL
jgi:hypothetical protein